MDKMILCYQTERERGKGKVREEREERNCIYEISRRQRPLYH